MCRKARDERALRLRTLSLNCPEYEAGAGSKSVLKNSEARSKLPNVFGILGFNLMDFNLYVLKFWPEYVLVWGNECGRITEQVVAMDFGVSVCLSVFLFVSLSVLYMHLYVTTITERP